MKLRRSRRSKRGRIEIIPMIDVMFFLLATFMLTSLAMPQGHAQQLSQDKPLTLSVNQANQVFINQQAVTLDQVAPMIARLLPRDANVVVAADDHASHGVVVQAMLAARRAGAEHFLVAVHHE
jgi:biopolymer transport protein ExbD